MCDLIFIARLIVLPAGALGHVAALRRCRCTVPHSGCSTGETANMCHLTQHHGLIQICASLALSHNAKP